MKLSVLVLNVLLERSMSQIFNLGLSFPFVSKRLLIIFINLIFKNKGLKKKDLRHASLYMAFESMRFKFSIIFFANSGIHSLTCIIPLNMPKSQLPCGL